MRGGDTTLRKSVTRCFVDKIEIAICDIQFCNDILHDQNDINESTRTQLDAISAALAELQSKGPRQRPKRRIGFIQDEEK